MSFVLRIDAERWRTHLAGIRDAMTAHPMTSLVPVVKGNGYGLGQARASRECESLGADVIAIGTIFEVDEVLAHALGDVLVLEPFDPRDANAAAAWQAAQDRWDAGRLIRTISTRAGLQTVIDQHGPVRLVLEGRTSMHRFGFSPDELQWVLAEPTFRQAVARGQLEVLGLSIHLPLEQPRDASFSRQSGALTPRAQEALRWCGIWGAEQVVADQAAAAPVWVSHLSEGELAAVRAGTDLPLRVRVGSRLWLGDRGALIAQGSVLAVHPLPAETHVGYRQRSGPRDGTLVVVSGGTAHGIGLSAPSPAASVRQRVVTAGTGALDAAGRSLSPFTWQGKQRWFAETPHQHHSMIWLPRGCVIPVVGDVIPADVRFTTSRFDAVLGLD